MEVGHSLPFADVIIINREGKVEFDIHRKSTHTQRTIPTSSNHSWDKKNGPLHLHDLLNGPAKWGTRAQGKNSEGSNETKGKTTEEEVTNAPKQTISICLLSPLQRITFLPFTRLLWKEKGGPHFNHDETLWRSSNLKRHGLSKWVFIISLW